MVTIRRLRDVFIHISTFTQIMGAAYCCHGSHDGFISTDYLTANQKCRQAANALAGDLKLKKKTATIYFVDKFATSF